MRSAYAPVAHNTSTAERTIRFGLDQASLVHLMGVLDNLYSDKILAVIREYSTNASDSHIQAGNTAPILVTLPKGNSLFFTVQDFGVGLSVEDLETVFSLYGASTKRDDDEATGTLGLGCKSAFTYAVSFSVDAVKDGRRTVADISKDADGVGAIRILADVETTDPNGVTVKIPVRQYDVYQFQTTAGTFFQAWAGRRPVLVDGEVPTGYELDEDTIQVDPDVLVLKREPHHSKVVMGGVTYPFDATTLGFSHGIVAWVPMGTVHFTPSREALHRTDLTKDTLDTLVAFAKQQLHKALAERLASAPTYWEAAKVAVAWSLERSASGLRWTTCVHLNYRTAWFGSNGSFSKVKRQINISDLNSDRAVVLDYPMKTVSPLSRLRLGALGIKHGYLLPVGADVTLLSGRPNVHRWNEIVELTEDVRVTERVKRVRTTYCFWVDNTLHSDGILDPARPITFIDGTQRYEESRKQALHLYPEAQIVPLYERQIPGFLRQQPGAVPFGDYKAKADKLVLDALTEDDKIKAGASSNSGYLWNTLIRHADRLSDPVFKALANAAKTQESPAARRCKALTLKIPHSTLYSRINIEYPLIRALSSSYVVLDGEALTDFINYINSKEAVTL